MSSAEPASRLVVAVDIDAETPSVPDGPALVVYWRAGAPVGLAQVQSAEEASSTLDRLRASVAPAREPWSGPRPSISVVVPTVVARVAELDGLLRSLDAADYPGAEILLVDNRPVVPADDPLPGLLTRFPRCRSIHEPAPGISNARNLGVKVATGEIIAFTDDDVRVDPGWLRAIGRRFAEQPSLDAVTGLILPAELERPAQIWFESYYGGFGGVRTFAPLTLRARGRRAPVDVQVSDAEGRPVRRVPFYGVGAFGAGANMAFRRSALRRIDGFDRALGTGTTARGGEDLAALITVLFRGGRIGFEPAAVVHHTHRRELSELLHQLRGNGVGYTAMMTSLVLSDPRHLGAIAGQLPVALRNLVRNSWDRLRGQRVVVGDGHAEDAPYPRSLLLAELSGYHRGPVAYLRSRAEARGSAAGGMARVR